MKPITLTEKEFNTIYTALLLELKRNQNQENMERLQKAIEAIRKSL